MGTVRDDMTLALRLAEQADALTLDRFGAMDLHVDTKPDLTPVTDADRSVESALRDTLATERPDDSVLGEEFGGTTVFTGRQWVIDPIDGTKNFVRGVPIWATLIALLQRRRAGCRRGKRARTAATLVGRRGRRARLPRSRGDRPGACRCHRWPRSGSASLSFSSLSGWAKLGLRRPVHRPHRRRLAGTRLRRLPVLLPGGRGSRRHRRRT